MSKVKGEKKKKNFFFNKVNRIYKTKGLVQKSP